MHGHSFDKGALSFGFGFHLCLHILGCFATCGTITETPSKCILLFDWKGWTQLPWQWFKPKRSSNILPDGTFLVLFSWILSGDSMIWPHGWARCLSRVMMRGHLLIANALACSVFRSPFFCWRLLGLIPRGAPFSQLSSGVKDAMVVSTKINVIL